MKDESALATALAAASCADAILGDPRRLHPVAGFGRLAAHGERISWRPNRLAGALYALTLVAAPSLAVGALERRVGPRARFTVRVLVIWASLGARSLWREGRLMARELEAEDIAAARLRAPNLVGRDPSELDSAELSRATLESVAENTSDAIVAPLLWAALAGAGGCAGYRAANTLDAMVGHRSPRYRQFGWGAARLDDLLNWPAARLTAALVVLVAPLVGGSPARCWHIVRRDGGAHPSPNAGRVEASFAGALDVRLGGENRYHGRLEQRPTLGDGQGPTATDVTRAVQLSKVVTVAAVLVTATIARRR